jgi:HSP20 family protein
MMNQMTRRTPRRSRSPIDELVTSFFGNQPMITFPVYSEGESLAVDVSEDEHSVFVRASLPGYSKEDIAVEVQDGVLTIEATTEEEVEETTERYVRRERREGSVSRRVSLPGAVVEDEANAELKDGVLKLTFPKVKEEAPRRIEIS